MHPRFHLLLLATTLMTITACHRPAPVVEYRHLSIAEFKRSVDSAVKAGDTNTKNFEVQGYYVNEKVPMLVPNLDLMRSNALLPDSARTGRLLPTSYEGALVSTHIAFRSTGRNLKHFLVHKRPMILHQAQQFISYLDRQISLLTQGLQPQKPAVTATNADKYAFRYSGGYGSINAH